MTSKCSLDNIRYVTNHDFPLALSYDDVLLVPSYSEIISRSQVDTKTKLSEKLTLEIPLISINMDTVTGVEMAIKMSELGGLGLIPRFDAPDVQAEKVARVKKAGQRVGAALGCKEGFLERAEVLVNAGVDLLTIDVAHGHMKKALEATGDLKNRFGDLITIMSGVVATYEGAKDHFIHGADVVRVGVGPGTICTTRVETGFGVPQITAISEAARAAREAGKVIVSDGGATASGHIVKALAAGASAHIAGSIYAGTDEAPGEKVEIDGKIYKEYNGSTSKKEKLRQIEKDNTDKDHSYAKHIEGVEAFVPYKGPVSEIVEKYVHNIRSGLSYAGAENIPDLWKKAKFIRITGAGFKESQAHDVVLIR